MADVLLAEGSVQREDPPGRAGEREVLVGFLEFHRSTLLAKCEALTGEQLAARAVPPSSMSLLGLVRHLADVERQWWRRVVDRQEAPPLFWTSERPDDDWDGADAALAAEDLAAWRAEVAEARAVLGRHELGEELPEDRWGRRLSVRWVLVHLVEEYARHNGHADLLRERVDGRTGE